MLSESLTLGQRWTFVGGKGGVGKTTVAAALAVELSDAGRDVLVLSTDPAHSLGDALGVPLGPDPTPVPGTSGLRALEVDAGRERDRFMSDHGDTLRLLIESGTYLDAEDSREVSGRAVPGLDELAALLRLARLAHGFAGSVIVDTAPTGHTLRLLELPELALRWIDAFDAMERRRAAVAMGLVREYRGDAATSLLQNLRADVEAVGALLRNPVATRMVLVTTPERVVLAETLRYQESLQRVGVAIGGVVVNRAIRVDDAEAGGVAPMLSVPIVDHPVGPDGLRGYSTAAAEGASPDRPRARDDAEGVGVRGVFAPPVDRHLYIVGGKGGVGKSTAAASIAIALAARGVRVRLIGIDPAGSLGDLLGVSGDRLPDPIHGSGSLQVTELDAQTVWSNFVDGYRERIEELFGRILSGGVSGTADREVLQRLMDLAPPGLDELVALLELVDASGDRIYDALVLDTAPTGHLLRLLEMPDVALDWCHTLMRLLLKYREVVPMGDVGEEVLDLTKRIRAFSRRLVDRDFTWFLAVALPEPLSLPETERLLARVRRTGIEPGALLINRAMDGDAIDPAAAHWARRLIALDPTLPAVGAPALSRGPTGTSGLRHYVEGWRIIEMR